jgi:hypothetical protein
MSEPNPPLQGRGTTRRVVEGPARLSEKREQTECRTCPSTTFGGPPPRAGED